MTATATLPASDGQSSADAGLILNVTRVTKDGGSYGVKCPHCRLVIGIDGDDLSEVRGEQFQHKRREYPGPNGPKSSGCDGWMQISEDAVFVRDL